MTNPRLEDHVVGLELQLVELVEQKQRAEVQGRSADISALERQIEALQAELATSAEVASAEPAVEAPEQPEVFAPHAADATVGSSAPA
jgi:DNA-binding protein H-NS